MSSTTTITKRLHISGVTPSITPADLTARFEAFGVNAKSVEGFDKLNGVGRPRGYGYVEVVGKEESVKRCVTALSGTTWKGAKLRIGDANPDFRERLERDRDTMPKPRVKRRRFHSTHSSLNLVTPQVAQYKKGYRVTETGRVVTLVRMRPARPLGPTVDASKALKDAKIGKGKRVKLKERRRDPPTRARKRTIDMMRYGSVHLNGAWLGEGAIRSGQRDSVDARLGEDGDATDAEEVKGDDEDGSEEESEGEKDGEVEEESESESHESESSEGDEEVQDVQPPASHPKPSAGSTISTSDDITREKAHSLGILHALFGDKEEWGGRESVSDVEMDDVHESELETDAAGSREQNEDVVKEDAAREEVQVHTEKEKSEDRKQKKLKDLFAPREEEGGFSLLGHLDLEDLELDEDISTPLLTAPSESAPAPAPAPFILPAASQQFYSRKQTQLALDPSQPLFFPISPSAHSEKGKAKDILDVFKEKGWSVEAFCLKEGDEEGAKKWEEEARHRWAQEKGELTRGWKKRWREAGKVRRRRGGADGE